MFTAVCPALTQRPNDGQVRGAYATRTCPWWVLLSLALAACSGRAQEPIRGDYWAHDPSTMIQDGSRYYTFRTSQGIMAKWSTDKVNWNYGGQVFPSGPPAWTTNAVPDFAGFFWAPDVAYFNGKYHLYYSCSSWGSIDSAIGLVTSPSLISPTWTDQGKVVQSDASWEAGPDTDTTSINCIDPSILVDTNGTIWMAYGSYSDGIMVTQIDPATGKRLNPASPGTKIASSSSSFFSNTTEGAHLHQRGGYYYLFLNYGGCCSGIDSTYNIRVGRSLNVLGPYLDRNGVNMLIGGGTMFMESTGRYIGPGHAGVFAENGTNWLTYHYYDALNNVPGEPTLGLAWLHWTDGWPMVTNDWSAFYPLDVDARDHRGAFSGALVNGSTTTNDPARGGVLNLDGATNWATIPHAVANASTFMAWVKWNGGDDWQRVFDCGVDTSRYLFLTPRANNGSMRFAIRNGGEEQQLDAPTALPTNSWCHVAVVLDGQSGTMFLNGVPVATNTSMTIRPWQTLARSNYLGDSQFAADPLFNGQLDSFRVFGRALNASEIRGLAWAHPALAHRYSFNGSAADSIGVAHGTLFGNATLTNNALKLTGATGGYVSLPGGLASRCSAVTFEFWAAFGANANWARVFDFGTTSGNFGSQHVFFSPRTSFGTQRFEISTPAGTFTRDPTPALDGQTVHVVCILDPTNNYAAIFTNGVIEMEATASIPPLTGVSTSLGYLGRSLFSGDGWLNATVDEFRIYHGRLTSEEITANFVAGPDALALPMRLEQTLNGDGNLELQWPSYGADFALESVEQLSSGGWAPVGGTAVISNGAYRLTQPAAAAGRFFRLKR